MCGIAGIISFKEHVNHELIKSMSDTLKHRGPDDEGYCAIDLNDHTPHPLIGDDSQLKGDHINNFDKRVNMFFAHRRLSIIDLSVGGHQPMANKDGTIWIVYNGEIYNYLELKEELTSCGYNFVTNTDTEVILASYEKWGQECVDKFNGMWAFTIYDKRHNVLFGSRDRFGVKPFYYFFDGKYFAFASEIKALLQCSFIEKRINSVAVFEFLSLGLEEWEEEGFFKSIFELKPAHSFELNLKTGNLKKWRYFDLDYDTHWGQFEEKKLEEHAKNIEELIVDAVKLRLRSDVPVGSCLSGGIDSSAIVCVISDLLKQGKAGQVGDMQKTFTASYPDNIIDESKWAEIVVNHANTSWNQTFPNSNDFLNDLEDLCFTQEIPFATTRTYAQYRVMKLAQKNGIKVLLDGQGADELFSGYPPTYTVFFAEILRNFDISRCISEFSSLKNSPIDSGFLTTSLLKLCTSKILPDNTIRFLTRSLSDKRKYISQSCWEQHSHKLNITKQRATTLNHMLSQYMGEYFLKALLRWEDRNSMRFSIEARTPFADDINLINYTFKVPSVYKIHNGWSKYLLRTSMEDFLPEAIKNRCDKLGFATPEHNWLLEQKNELKTYLSKDLEEFVNIDRVLKAWERPLSQSSVYNLTDTSMWKILSFAVWKKVFKL